MSSEYYGDIYEGMGKTILWTSVITVAVLFGVFWQLERTHGVYNDRRDAWMAALCGSSYGTRCIDNVCYYYVRAGKHSNGAMGPMVTVDGGYKQCDWERAKATGITNEQLNPDNYSFWLNRVP